MTFFIKKGSLHSERKSGLGCCGRMQKSIAIVGAGIAGLAAAVRLATQGHRVELFETNSFAGGKLSEFSLGHYRFDLGPSLFTMPQYVDALFEEAGEDPRAHFNYQRLDVVCRYWWEDGSQLAAHGEVEKLAQACEHSFGVPAKKVIDFMAKAAHKYEVSGRIFLEKSLHKLDTWLDISVLKAMAKIAALDLTNSMHQVHERDLGHPKLVQLFDRFATYNGSNPYKAPGLLSMIPHFEHHFGAYLPEGGMYDIAQAIYGLGQRLGVQYHFNSPVAAITHEKGKAKGIRLSSGLTLPFDAVVCNMDVFLAYDKLLADVKKPARTLRQQKSTSAIIFYWGIAASFPQLGLHNILFSDNYRAEFAALEAGSLHNDPTVYINISSKLVPSDAPKGHENWFVMVNAPPNQGQAWEEMIPQLRQQVIEKIDRLLTAKALAADGLSSTSIAPWIQEERILGPTDIEKITGSHQGALYGSSSNKPMAAFLRHPNFSSQIKDLYFLGGSVHPGGGVPLCLLSAQIVANLVEK